MTRLTEPDLRLLREKVEILNGDRRGAADKRALRYGDIKNLPELIATLKTGASQLEKQIKTLTDEAQDLAAQLAVVQQGLEEAAQQLESIGGVIDGKIVTVQTAIVATATTATAAKGRTDDMSTAAAALTIAAQVSIPTAAGPPTQAEFNDAVTDITELFDVVTELKSILAG